MCCLTKMTMMWPACGVWCVVIAVTRREWRRPSPPFLPTPVPTPNPTYTYLQYPFLPLPRPTYYTQSYQHFHYPSSSWDQGGIFWRLRMCNYDWLKTSGIICRTGLLNICSYVTAGNCITWVSLVQNCSNLTANLFSCLQNLLSSMENLLGWVCS